MIWSSDISCCLGVCPEIRERSLLFLPWLAPGQSVNFTLLSLSVSLQGCLFEYVRATNHACSCNRSPWGCRVPKRAMLLPALHTVPDPPLKSVGKSIWKRSFLRLPVLSVLSVPSRPVLLPPRPLGTRLSLWLGCCNLSPELRINGGSKIRDTRPGEAVARLYEFLDASCSLVVAVDGRKASLGRIRSMWLLGSRGRVQVVVIVPVV